MIKFRKLFSFVLLFFCFLSSSEEVTIEIRQDSPDIKKAEKQAVRQVSLALMQKFIESSKLKEQKKQIQKIISTSFNRYILYIRSSVPIKEGNSFITPITIGFSEHNLKQILLKEELFYTGSSQIRIWPLILYEDIDSGKFYKGWMQEEDRKASGSLKKDMNLFYNAVQESLLQYGFFVANPEQAQMSYFIPESLEFSRPKKAKIFQLARFLKYKLVMTGNIKVRKISSALNVKIQLAVYHVDNGRLLAEMEKQENFLNTDKALLAYLKNHHHFAQDLGTQLKTAYDSGHMDDNIFHITIEGSLSYKESQLFKKALLSQVKEIKSLTENIIKSGSTSYIAHASATTDTVFDKIKKLKLSGFNIDISHPKQNQIKLKARVAHGT